MRFDLEEGTLLRLILEEPPLRWFPDIVASPGGPLRHGDPTPPGDGMFIIGDNMSNKPTTVARKREDTTLKGPTIDFFQDAALLRSHSTQMKIDARRYMT